MPTRGRQHRKTSANSEHPTLRKKEAAGCSWWRRWARAGIGTPPGSLRARLSGARSRRYRPRGR